MKRIATALILAVTVWALVGCGESSNQKKVNQETSLQSSSDTQEVSEQKETDEVQGTSTDNSGHEGGPCELTEEQEMLTGMWESPEGCIMAIRARSEAAVNTDLGTGFPLDVIYFYPYNFEGVEETDSKGWTKFTINDDECSITVGDGNIVLVNSTWCPTMDNPDEYVSCEYKIVLDTSTNEMFFSYSKDEWIEREQVAYSFTLLPSEKDIEEANWDWYYSFEPYRDPR